MKRALDVLAYAILASLGAVIFAATAAAIGLLAAFWIVVVGVAIGWACVRVAGGVW